MPKFKAAHVTNRRALIAFTSVLVGVMILIALLVIYLQRQQLLHRAQEELQTEILLLGELATDALLQSDYDAVEGLVRSWLARHDYLIALKAVMPNGFVLAEVRRPGNGHPMEVTQEVQFEGRKLMTLYAVGDFSTVETGIASIVLRVAGLAVVVVALLGLMLWWTLRRTALLPLEQALDDSAQKERELLERTVELETAIQELESFSYSISHDLRGPLRAIDGFSHALIEDYGQVLNDTARDYIHRSRSAAQRMGVLIDDLLALSRMARRELVVEEVDLSKLAHETIERLKQAEPGRQVFVEVTEGMRVSGDPGLLSVVLENLLGNAWKYTSRKDPAHIGFGPVLQDGQTAYCVRDDGVGFDMTYADRLFLPFQRLHSAKEYAGTGIGLATVARIIQRHDGRVWGEGAAGKGAMFCFTLGAKRTEASKG